MPYYAINSLQNLITSTTFEGHIAHLSPGATSRKQISQTSRPLPEINQSRPILQKRARYKYSAYIRSKKINGPQVAVKRKSDSSDCVSASIPRKSARIKSVKRIYFEEDDLSRDGVADGLSDEALTTKAISPPKTSYHNKVIVPRVTNHSSSSVVDFTQIQRQACLLKAPHIINQNVSISSKPSQIALGLHPNSLSIAKCNDSSASNQYQQTSSSYSGARSSKYRSNTSLDRNCESPELVQLVPDLSKIAPMTSDDVFDRYSDYVSNIKFVPYVRKPPNSTPAAFEFSEKVPLTDMDVVEKRIRSNVHAGLSSKVKQKAQDVQDDSSSRLLPLSDQALTQARLLGFSFGKSSKHCKTSYAVDFKLCVVEWFIENDKNTAATADKFQINRKQVYSWYKDREKLKEWASKTINSQTSKVPSRRLVTKGEWSRYKELDERLFNRCVSTNGVITVSNGALRKAAVEEAHCLGYKEFKASYPWLQMWKERVKKHHNLKLVLKNRNIVQWEHQS